MIGESVIVRYLVFILVFMVLLWAVWSVAGLFLRSDGKGEGVFIVLPVAGHTEDIEIRVRSLICGSRSLRGAAILLADFGADGETAEICRRLCEEFEKVEWIDGNDVFAMINNSLFLEDK